MNGLGGEHVAFRLLAMMERGAKGVELGPFITEHHRPDWAAVDEYMKYAGSGDKAVAELARAAWNNEGVFRTLSAQDSRRRATVLAAILEGYAEWLPRETP